VQHAAKEPAAADRTLHEGIDAAHAIQEHLLLPRLFADLADRSAYRPSGSIGRFAFAPAQRNRQEEIDIPLRSFRGRRRGYSCEISSINTTSLRIV